MAVIRLLTAIGFSICMPFLALHLHQDRGVSMTLAGLILLAGGLCAAVSQAIGGVLSDRFGRRPLLLVAASAGVFLYAGLAVLLARSAPIWAITLIYIAGRSMLTTTHPVISAMVADFAPREKLTEAYGILRIGANIGWAAGPAIGGHLLEFVPYAWLFAIPAAMCGIAFVIVLFFIRESSSRPVYPAGIRSFLPPVENPPFLVFTLISLLLFIVMGQMGSTLSISTVDRFGFLESQYGFLLTLNGLIVIFFQYPITRVLARVSKSRALVLGSLLYCFGYVSFGWITGFGWALAAMAVVTAGEIIHTPITLAVTGELSPPGQRGQYMGFFGLSETLGIAVAPLLGGILLDAFPSDMRIVWAPLASIALVAAVAYRWWARRYRQ
ncbi:MAG: MDR family MFS transporter [Dehalococcoidia bacterium]